jgi:hypothetical protein
VTDIITRNKTTGTPGALNTGELAVRTANQLKLYLGTGSGVQELLGGPIDGGTTAADTLKWSSLLERWVATSELTVNSVRVQASVPFRAPIGDFNTPTYSFDGDVDTGFYREVAGGVGITGNGDKIGSFDLGGDFSVVRNVLAGDGDELNPSFTFTSDPDTGMYRKADNTIGFSRASVEMMSVGTNVTITNDLRVGDGDAVSPSLTFGSDTTTGLYYSNTNEMSVATGGVQAFVFGPSANVAANPIQFFSGSVDAPSITFFTDEDTGMYRSGTDEVTITCAGANVMTWQAGLVIGPSLLLTGRMTSATMTLTSLPTEAGTTGVVYSDNGTLKISP